jgi:hypothetical protein
MKRYSHAEVDRGLAEENRGKGSIERNLKRASERIVQIADAHIELAQRRSIPRKHMTGYLPLSKR